MVKKMANENVKDIPLLNDLIDEVFEDTNSFVQDITSSIKLMPLAALGSFALSIITYWIYFQILKSTGVTNLLVGILATGSLVYLGVVIIQRYYRYKEKYARLFQLRDEWEAIKEKQ